MNPSDFTDQELDRLKEIAVDDDVLRFPSRHLPEYGEVMKALPGLLRVCDAFIEAETFRLNESGVWYPDEPYDVWRSGNREKAEKKLEELL